ncbi:hypothetical protein DUNSADRAFT_13231 [Dunaliella salina]|uniref:Uncharacterized protein n=1 Tax=Dunaliella salina TaxID=3046 RepID=A0ABQ7H3H7_DUNSA|nr:hypothetical protein DUNSADRAFT_13231 [Dunaliella salina]|eukprot:KAF5841363.1 hypothetical protein DUNSADRAFT_13231 [Dunaliella salina]
MDHVVCCSFPPDPSFVAGQVLVSGGWDRSVNIWDLRLARAVRSVSGPYICGGDNLDIRGEELVTGSWRRDKPLQLWDIGSGRLLTNCPFYQPELDACMLYAAKFTPGPEDLILAGGSGRRPCVKAFQTNGQVLGTLAVPSGVNAMASSSTWSEKHRSAVFCCADRVLLMKI